MHASTIIVTITVLIASINAPLSPDLIPVVPGENLKKIQVRPSETGVQEALGFAKNEGSVPVDEESTDTGFEGKESGPPSASETDGSRPSDKAKVKALKPFVPSEKIPAEQAVDFPVDI
jgi:hypothetical protein